MFRYPSSPIWLVSCADADWAAQEDGEVAGLTSTLNQPWSPRLNPHRPPSRSRSATGVPAQTMYISRSTAAVTMRLIWCPVSSTESFFGTLKSEQVSHVT